MFFGHISIFFFNCNVYLYRPKLKIFSAIYFHIAHSYERIKTVWHNTKNMKLAWLILSLKKHCLRTISVFNASHIEVVPYEIYK